MGSRSNNDGGGGGGVGIPEGSRKIVRSLKEVVGSTEAEIYAMLKDCNMDPNEAVNRLLSQDPFHEVKSKREKKKENKNTTEPKSRSSRGGRGSSNHYVGRSGTQYSSSDTGPLHGKPAYNKENGSNAYASHSSVSSGTTGSNAYHRPPAQSDYAKVENKVSITDTSDGGWSSSQPSSGNQPVWGGVPGQISMADIVKMGRPPGKPSRSTPNHDLNNSKVSLDNNNNNNEWPSFEPSTRISPVVQPASDWDTNETQFSSNIITQHTELEQEEVPVVEDEYVENISENHEGYDSVSDWRIQNNNNSEGASHLNSDVYENTEGYQPQENVVEYREVEDIGVTVSSVTSTLQQLNVINGHEAQPEENVDIIIPDHLQVQTEDCLHLSFGSFGSLSAGPASSLPFSSIPTNNNNIEEDGADIDAPSVGHLDTRNSEYYGDESLRTASDGNLVHRTGVSGATEYDSPSVSQSEVSNQENHEGGTHENQYAFPPSHNYSFENAGQLNASFPPSQTSAQMQTSSDQGYAYTLPSSFLAANAQLKREADYSYSPFAMGQSMPAHYGNLVPSVSNSTVSMPEAAGLSSTQQTPQNQPGSNIATGPALPQQLLHQYAQMGQFPNLMGYPFLPQNYYLPGAYQQAAYHQSLNAQQYKNSVSVSSLPQSAAVASGYGGNFGSPTGNFSANQPSAQGTGAVGYEDVLSSQYKEASHLLSLQQAQNENQAMWLQGHGSRTISGIPANTYYSYLGQNQQQQTPAGFRQNQLQPSQNYGSLGNSNFYNSQSGILLDHQHQQQQQNPRDGSQIQANKQQSQQLWQNSY